MQTYGPRMDINRLVLDDYEQEIEDSLSIYDFSFPGKDILVQKIMEAAKNHNKPGLQKRNLKVDMIYA